MSKAKVEKEFREALREKSQIPQARAKKLVATLNHMLPKLGDLASGQVVIGVTPHGLQTCSGGHLCGGEGPSPGDGPDNPDCGTEACDTQICEDGHICNNQSCGTEACDAAHSCTGAYKGVIDVAAMNASTASAWKAVKAAVDKNVKKDMLDVEVKFSR